MGYFLRKIILFILFPATIGAIIFTLLTYYVSYKLSNYEIDQYQNCIFIGDSHIEVAINDQFCKNIKNIACSSESIYYSYFKLEKILNNNSNIRYIYLGFSYHNISNYYDDVIYGDKSFYIAPRYFALLNYKEQIKILLINVNSLSLFVKRTIKEYINIIFFSKMNYIGGYKNNFFNTNVIDISVDKRIKYQFYNGNHAMRSFSDINIYYLFKIKRLCKDKNVMLILINTPLHSKYYQKIPINYIEKYNHIIRQLDVELIDLNGLNLDDNCFIPDGDHVSVKGSKMVTNYLINLKHFCGKDSVWYTGPSLNR